MRPPAWIVFVASIAFNLALVATSTTARAGVSAEDQPCRFSGRATGPSIPLFGASTATSPFARLGASPFDVALDGLGADLVGTHVHLHAVSLVKNAASTVTVDAFTDLSAFELRTAHVVTVVPDHVWIRRDFTISAVGAALGRLQISASAPDWPAVLADVPCSEVSLGAPPPNVVEQAAFEARFAQKGERRLLAGEEVTFRDAPGGKIVYQLSAANLSGFARTDVDAYEEKGGYRRVVLRGTPFIDAWVDSDSLDVPPMMNGVTCGGCCGKGVRRPVIYSNGKNIPLAVVTTTTLHLAPHTLQVVATLAVGTPLIGREAVDGWMRVELRNKELVAADGEAFWVRATDLVRVKLSRKR